MGIPECHFRHIFLFYFRKGKNAAQAYRKLCGVYGDQCFSVPEVPEISMLKMNLALAGQSLKKSMKFFKKSR